MISTDAAGLIKPSIPADGGSRSRRQRQRDLILTRHRSSRLNCSGTSLPAGGMDGLIRGPYRSHDKSRHRVSAMGIGRNGIHGSNQAMACFGRPSLLGTGQDVPSLATGRHGWAWARGGSPSTSISTDSRRDGMYLQYLGPGAVRASRANPPWLVWESLPLHLPIN